MGSDNLVERKGSNNSIAPATKWVDQKAQIIEMPVQVQKTNMPWPVVFLLSSVSYFLLMTDVYRTGASFDLSGIQEIRPGVYTDFGPWAYPIINITRSPSGEYTAIRRGVPQEHARVWSYKYDTTSYGMRSMVRRDNVTTWPDCLTYKSECNSKYLPLRTGFEIIDGLMESIATRERPRVINGAPHLMYSSENPEQALEQFRKDQKLAYDGISVCNRLDNFFHYLADLWTVQSRKMRNRVMYYGNVTKDDYMGICDRGNDIPYMCIRDFSDYSISRRGSKGVDRMWDHMEKRVKSIIKDYPGKMVDFVLFDGSYVKQAQTGGIAEFDMIGFVTVTFIRVRECAQADDLSTCQTIMVDDFRYEGNTKVTDIADWNTLVMFIRYTAQIYYHVRLLALIVGVYRARINDFKGKKPTTYLEKAVLTIRVMFKVPNQVMIYSSHLPVALYSLAQCIDSHLFQAEAEGSLIVLDGGSIEDPLHVFSSISVFMRSVWLLGAASTGFVKMNTFLGWNPSSGVLGFQGHSFAFISILSVFLGFRHHTLRRAEILNVFDLSNSFDQGVHDVYGTGIIYKIYQVSGVFANWLGIAIGMILFICIRLLIRSIRIVLSRKSLNLNTLLTGNDNRLLLTVTQVPTTCGVLWSKTSLCVGWKQDILSSSTFYDTSGGSNENWDFTMVLMNVVMLSDPVNYLLLQWNRPTLYCFQSLTGEVLYSTNSQLSSMGSSECDGDSGSKKPVQYKLIGRLNPADEPWHRLIRLV